MNPPVGYRGRIAPSPTGFLHLGHASTFWRAFERARDAGGVLVLRDDDLDASRALPAYSAAQMEDLRWFGLTWNEGPDTGGPFGPYRQSQRSALYSEAFHRLQAIGAVYPCFCSRKDIQSAARAPQAGDDECIYSGTCRPENLSSTQEPPRPASWRFRVPDGEVCSFVDGAVGSVSWTAGRDFGDFIVWRSDGTASYQLACIVDDVFMRITEVVRGSDLLLSTIRQQLLARALGFQVPNYYHCPLVCDSQGIRLAKRNDALSLRHFRENGWTPDQIRLRPDFTRA